jgi:hypothetical protein
MIDPGDRRQARGDTGGEDRLIESQQIVCRNADRTMLDLNGVDLRLNTRVTADDLLAFDETILATDRHLRANRRFVAQDIQVAEHLGMIDPGDRRQARGSTPRCT